MEHNIICSVVYSLMITEKRLNAGIYVVIPENYGNAKEKSVTCEKLPDKSASVKS